MKMIDWNALIKTDTETETPETLPKSRACPTTHDDDFEKVGRAKPNGHHDFEDSARLARPARPKNERVGLEQENNSPGEGEASDKYCATETYPVNPIAMCLLLTCCHKAIFNREETLEAIINLQTIPQPEQIRSWAILCQKYGIDPYRAIYPFTNSPNKGTSCQGCKHIEMQKIPTGKRSVYRFVCSQHHQILEAYYAHERVLIAPESCRDYLPTA